MAKNENVTKGVVAQTSVTEAEVQKALELLERTRKQQKKQLERAKVRRVWLELMARKASEKGIVVTDAEVQAEMKKRA